MEPTCHFLAGKKIIVAGAGLAGLSFASALRKVWPSSLTPPTLVIYERDTQEGAVGREGYSISVAGYDETGGLYALKQLGLLDEALQHAVLGLDDHSRFKTWDQDWKTLVSVRFKPAKGLPTSGIRIARSNLRRVLVNATEGIAWDVACTSARRLENGRMAVTVVRAGEPTEEECDLLVCADGSNSRLRASLRPDDGLHYAGAAQLGGLARFDKIPSPIDENWGLMVTGQGISCFYSPVDKNRVVWALGRLEPDCRPPLDKSSPENLQAVLDECLQLGHMIGEPFSTIVRATELESVFAMSTKDKEGFRHDISLGQVVFLGDSNHAVSPFAGYGASLAMKDGWDFAQQLCWSKSLVDALKAYDDISLPRATKVLKTSRSRIVHGHCVGPRYFLFRCFLAVGGFMLWLTGQS